jgi:hypothetical protein
MALEEAPKPYKENIVGLGSKGNYLDQKVW